MLFSFNTWNHCRQGQIIVEDITAIMGHQLMALGHDVSWENSSFVSSASGYNVVLESFADDPATIANIAKAHDRGARFVYVATEEPTPAGFNHGLEPAMIDRQNAFPAAARFCDGILHLVPGAEVTAWYGQFAQAAYAELGHAPILVQPDDGVEPTHDFGFYGKMTWRREQMLGRLERESGQRLLLIDSLDVPRAARDAKMRLARVIVQIRANEEWGMVSSTRCASALYLGRPVVAEPHPFAEPWDRVVSFSRTVESFYADALALARGDWRSEHHRQIARFERELTPERCIGEPLRKIGIL